MIQPVATTPLLDFARTQNRSTLKHFLFNRLFANWKDHFLVASVAYLVAGAVVSFFSGAWIAAFAQFFIGGTLANIRRDYRKFTNLNKITGRLEGTAATLQYENYRYGRENDHHRRLNEEHRRENAVYRHQNAVHAAENAAQRAANAEYRQQNALHAAENAEHKRQNFFQFLNNAAQAKQIEELNIAIGQIFSHATHLSKEVDQMRERNRELAASISKLEGHRESMRGLLKSASQEISHVSRGAAQILQEALQSIEGKGAAMSAMVVAQRKATDHSTSQLQNASDRFEQIMAKTERDLQTLIAEVAALKAEKAVLEQDLAKLNAKIKKRSGSEGARNWSFF